ncbi:MAG: class I SAM-dependent methyltransferase [Polyangiaceae bacterium]|jgi:SAM-dependent methyltransferase|nr:class I SAM-dependent methyltransferase [Polyangiaceae bacterium]
MSWSHGYVSEVEYTAGYFVELSPLQARWALTCRGVRTRDLTRPRYLELGIGRGVSLAIHAAGGAGEYWGNDFNPAHCAEAEELMAVVGAGAQVTEASFDELAQRDDLPTFDMIALHGVWSWISEANRGVVVDILRRKLAPGGVVYVSYNTTPGWTPMTPVRHLLQLHAERVGTESEGIVKRVEAALDFVDKLGDAGSLYFKANPRARERLNKFRDKSKKYVAHELMTADWHPMPFAQAADELAAAKLAHGANATLLEQIDALHLTPAGQTMVSGISDVVLRETVRDFLSNTGFRRDYFVRGPRRLSNLEQTEALRQFRVVLTEDPTTIELEVKGSLGTAKLQESVYRPVIDALAQGNAQPKSLAELASTCSGTNFGHLVQAVTVLIGKSAVALVQPDAEIEAALPRTRALNQHLLDRARSSAENVYLASPVTSAGIFASRTEQLFLLAARSGTSKPSGWAEHAWSVLSSQGQRLMVDGKRVESEEDNRRELVRQAEAFETMRLPVLRRLQVV